MIKESCYGQCKHENPNQIANQKYIKLTTFIINPFGNNLSFFTLTIFLNISMITKFSGRSLPLEPASSQFRDNFRPVTNHDEPSKPNSIPREFDSYHDLR